MFSRFVRQPQIHECRPSGSELIEGNMYGGPGEGPKLKQGVILFVAIVDDPHAIYIKPLETQVFIPKARPRLSGRVANMGSR